MVTETHLKCFRAAFSALLQEAAEGTMVFVRCLPSEVLKELCASELFTIPGWTAYGVVEGRHGESFLSADQAVDLREQKQGRILLLVDRAAAGAGMDGIYSAVREITERELFDETKSQAIDLLPHGTKKAVRAACSRARKLGKRNSISPWQEFDFYAQCASEPAAIGKHIARLGLWPIAVNKSLQEAELEVSAKLVDRLFLVTGSTNTVNARINSLLLPADASDQAARLERFLRDTASLRWREGVLQLQEHPDFWLNRLRPQFVGQALRKIDIVSWRAPRGALLRWSGLQAAESNIPALFLPKEEEGKCRLEVRWKTEPSDLAPDSVLYEVAIVTGSDTTLAVHQVPHTGKDIQKCVFTEEDFADLDEDGKWEAFVRVHPVGEAPPAQEEEEASPTWQQTEDFILTYGSVEAPVKSSVARKVRAFVEEAITSASEEEFGEVCRTSVVEQGSFITFRIGNRSGRVFRPRLIAQIEESWRINGFQIGRWVIRTREDGSAVGQPEFEAAPREVCETDLWKKLEDATRQLGQKAMERCGFIGLIYRENETADRYVNAWSSAFESANPLLALANTLEVQDLSGTTVGLVVLPSHPLRVAWHQAYDELAFWARYHEGLKPAQVVRTLKPIDGSYFPAFLPGVTPESSFVFGDMLGFYSTVMLRDREGEPQAAIAHIVMCLSPGGVEVAPAVSQSTAAVIASEVRKYSEQHREYGFLRVNTLRPGDGLTVSRALGLALHQDPGVTEEESSEESTRERTLGYTLDLFPSEGRIGKKVVGRHLSEITERRRAGVGEFPEEDRWMLETLEVAGRPLPVLRWAKRESFEKSMPVEPVHLSVAFDTFDSVVTTIQPNQLTGPRPLEVFGLFPSLVRSFCYKPLPAWITTIAIQPEGEKHPCGRGLSERLQKVHSAILGCVALNLGFGRDAWPVLKTEVSAAKADTIQRLHELSDWVITVDRNAGIEYFDAPRENPEIYDTYVIDCVPERQDLDCVQLVTSTSQVEEVMQLLNRALADMGLSCSPRNCTFLLTQLKALSGRLAMRLAGPASARSELIALSMFWSNCNQNRSREEWLTPGTGFFLPLDDIRELLHLKDSGKDSKVLGMEEIVDQPAVRSDLVYVNLSRQSKLRFTFIEIKYRRLLRSANEPRLLEQVQAQNRKTREVWLRDYFSPELTPTQLLVRRKRLAKALQFYADKARRHELEEEHHIKLCQAIDRLYRSDAEVASDDVDDRGYIFCPEYSGDIVKVDSDGETRIYLFSPHCLPDKPVSQRPDTGTPPESSTGLPPQETTPPASGDSSESALPVESSSQPLRQTNDDIALLLGHSDPGQVPVEWGLTKKGNPHLMLVGLPGMGKTTCIVNLCEQLAAQGVWPLVFSYHHDIESTLGHRFSDVNLVDLDHGLGFNPLRVVSTSPHGWIDNVGMLRDIFASIYSDFGEIQTNEIREAVKQSYVEVGYGVQGKLPTELPVPAFQRFFEILKQKSKPNQGILYRLTELDDYGFFRAEGQLGSLLETQRPTIIRINATQNEVIQAAMASFLLLSIYQGMFLRGDQQRITHAIIFDEAHRASRLKLLPTMAKECRKYGLSLIVASQAAKDFSTSLYSAIANYLVLRVVDADAKALAKNVVQSDDATRVAGRLKQLQKFSALFFCEGKRPQQVNLQSSPAEK